MRTRRETKADHAPLLAAGVAFYGLLAMVPALVALITIYGVVADPDDITRQVGDALAAAPSEVRDLVESQLRSIQDSSGRTSMIAIVAGLAVALWSASSGMSHLIEAVNVAYDEEETRGFLRRRALSLAMTLGAIVFVVVSFVVIALLPSIVASTGLGDAGRLVIGVVRWVVLLAAVLVAIAVLYRYAPDRQEPRWAWATPGSILAAVIWLAGSALFSVYAANFGKYNETYGSLGVVVVVMLWLFIGALGVILGAELNAELERQTVHDTTTDEPRPLGAREAHAADTVGEATDTAAESSRSPWPPPDGDRREQPSSRP